MSQPAPPHLASVPALNTRRGGFWIPGEIVEWNGAHVQRGPLWVEWESPETPTRPHPLVLVHGGGGQGTDWLVTPDGRPGWAREFVAAGFAVYVVDRPGHGRSPHHPEVLGAPGAPGSVEMTIGVFAPPPAADAQTQWPGGRSPDDPVVAQLAASSGFLLADLAEANALDGARLGELLERIGSAVLVTHSVGALGGWAAAATHPDLVTGILAVEPMGPPGVEVPGLGALVHGLTASPLAGRLDGIPVALMTGSASPLGAAAPLVAQELDRLGARTELIPLEGPGLAGNGHGVMFESNSSATAARAVEWLAGLA